MRYLCVGLSVIASLIMISNIITFVRLLINLNKKSYIDKMFNHWNYKLCLLMMLIFLPIYIAVSIVYFTNRNINLTAINLMIIIAFFGCSVFVRAIIFNMRQMLSAIENKKNETIIALVNAEEAKDFYTRGHSLHVCLIILKFYEKLPDDLRSKTSKTILEEAAILHDIGKIGITDTVLNKPGKLTEEEYDLIKKHPRYGATILKDTGYKNIADIIYNHHERIDGNGYYGVPDEKIPLESKMIAIADTFSALTTDRIYRLHKSIDEAIYVIQEEAGTQFDPQLVNIFCSIDQIELEDTEKELKLKLTR